MGDLSRVLLGDAGEAPRLVYGTVATSSPLTVTVPPSTVAVPAAALRGVLVAVGDKVAILQQGADRLIIGSTMTAVVAPLTAYASANQAFNIAVANINNLGIAVANCRVGDILIARTEICCFRQTISVAGDTGTALITCTNTTAAATSVGNVHFGTLNDIGTMTIEQMFTCSVAGTCTVNTSISSTAANADYALLAAGRTYCTVEHF